MQNPLKEALQHCWENHLRLEDAPESDQNTGPAAQTMKPLSEWLQLEPELFPLPEMLLPGALRELTSSLLTLYRLYAYDIRLPDELTDEERYFWLVCALNIAAPGHPTGHKPVHTIPIHICEGSSKQCPFGGTCTYSPCVKGG